MIVYFFHENIKLSVELTESAVWEQWYIIKFSIPSSKVLYSYQSIANGITDKVINNDKRSAAMLYQFL